MDHKITTDYTRLLGNANVKVFVRARPCADGHDPPTDMFERKPQTPKNIVIKDTERMQYGNHAFSFDNIYWTDTNQSTLFESTSKHLVDCALRGINSCCFAYGQTGSGKTFSIFGEAGEKAGLLPRSIEYLFDRIERNDWKTKEVTMVVSFLEIYCDRVRDLSRAYLKKTGRTVSYQTSSPIEWYLRQQQMHRIESSSSFSSGGGKADEDYDYERANFEIHEDAQGRVFVKDLAMVTVTSREEVDAIVQSGLKLRSTYETKMNAVSSRSHTVFSIHVFQHIRDSDEIICGMLNMVDLAGSERLKKSESDGQRLKEALHINSSLSAVGKVVMSLDPESGYNYIPYRDSKLTRLLQNSIGGNCITMLLATIHPMKEHYEECLSTLQFANRCRSVQNQPRVNYVNGSIVDKDRRIRRLQEEVSQLRRQLEGLRSEYNNRFVTTLNELGFDAEEITENGEIKFADGLVLPCIFADQDADLLTGNKPTFQDRPTAQGLSDSRITKTITMNKSDRDQLKQKYTNVKNNFAHLASESRKERDEMRKVVADQKRKILALENAFSQRNREHERALAAKEVKHREEITEILRHSDQIQQNDNQRKSSLSFHEENSAAVPKGHDQLRQSMHQRIAVMESAKNQEISLIRQQFNQILLQKDAEILKLKTSVEEQQASMAMTIESLRDDCLDLYAYTSKLVNTAESANRNLSFQTPKNVLADPNKLRAFKSLIASSPARFLDSVKRNSDEMRVIRPGSAPVRRSKQANFPSNLRKQVASTNSLAKEHSSSCSELPIESSRKHEKRVAGKARNHRRT